MTKQEIKDALKAAGKFDSNTKDNLWAEAFAAYSKETKRKLSMSCGSCFNTVRNWLNA